MQRAMENTGLFPNMVVQMIARRDIDGGNPDGPTVLMDWRSGSTCLDRHFVAGRNIFFDQDRRFTR
jgi:hypothetical protein